LSEFLERIRALISAGEVRVSDHGYDELAVDRLTAREVVAGVRGAVVVEEYPNYPKGPSVLLLQKDRTGKPIHVVWGIPRGYDQPVVLVTAYRPDPDRWDETYINRR
jgi:hypothetical protein